ncbi:Unannotated [Lentimonas sp. CC19]|nr:Unannotated [Lentimonas sp. CC4]CAA6687417.1 Unannotated [Lentimonas sp. CC6]CAA6692487.1 Unannotated [Lentimonas sp. CC19]CAA6696818.1 Unannotated [Lentimonas sp. CC10]CAA7070765.1 Unannotated [Lentimonas sp. CC11]CAA7172057.1 Unannotated [Lentimonas sp. CC21]CAA7183586.1 Unannotated [Lentimonas sp. CC8]
MIKALHSVIVASFLARIATAFPQYVHAAPRRVGEWNKSRCYVRADHALMPIAHYVRVVRSSVAGWVYPRYNINKQLDCITKTSKEYYEN